MTEYKSNWNNVIIHPDEIQAVKYNGNNKLQLFTAAPNGLCSLTGLASQKIFRMTKQYKREFDIVENLQDLEKNMLGILQSRKQDLVLRQWMPTGEFMSVVGTDYVPIDTIELSMTAYDQLDNDGIQYHSGKFIPMTYARGHDRMTIILAEERKITKVGDIVRSGIQILNNELGTRALHLQSFIERLACTNGMTSRKFGVTFSKIHLGNKDSILTEFKQSVKNLVNSRWEFMELFQSKQDLELTKQEMLDIVAHHQQDNFISLKTATELMKIVEDGLYGAENMNLYGLINAYTGLASRTENWTVRDQLENLVDSKFLVATSKEQLLY